MTRLIPEILPDPTRAFRGAFAGREHVVRHVRVLLACMALGGPAVATTVKLPRDSHCVTAYVTNASASATRGTGKDKGRVTVVVAPVPGVALEPPFVSAISGAYGVTVEKVDEMYVMSMTPAKSADLIDIPLTARCASAYDTFRVTVNLMQSVSPGAEYQTFVRFDWRL